MAEIPAQHPTCVETTTLDDLPFRTYVCGPDCPRPAGPDPDRDARIDVYRDRERRRAARALDRYIEAMFLSQADVPQRLGMGECRVAAGRFVEAVGDYVLSRLAESSDRDVAFGLQQKSHYGVRSHDEAWEAGQPCGQCGTDGPETEDRCVASPHNADSARVPEFDRNGCPVPHSADYVADLADSDCLRLTERAEYCPAAGSPRCESCVWRPAAAPCQAHGEHPHNGMTCLDCPICRP